MERDDLIVGEDCCANEAVQCGSCDDRSRIDDDVMLLQLFMLRSETIFTRGLFFIMETRDGTWKVATFNHLA